MVLVWFSTSVEWKATGTVKFHTSCALESVEKIRDLLNPIGFAVPHDDGRATYGFGDRAQAAV